MAKLPILMYHKISAIESRGLTISAEKLERQFQYLADNGFHTHHLSTLSILKKLPKQKNNIVLTFDDGYVSQQEFVVPLLQKYNLKATFFIPLKYVGKEDEWNEVRAPIMDFDMLKSLDPTLVELGYHSFTHEKYTEMSLDAIEADTQLAFEFASENGLPMGPSLAYPFGKFHRKEPEQSQFFKLLKEFQFEHGLRIGNRINQFPFKKKYEIQRIDVKGEWSLSRFKRRIRFGKMF